MPMINIKFDDSKVGNDEITLLSQGVQKIVSEVTGIKDVFVYADSPRIKIKVAPIEVFVQMSAFKIVDRDTLTGNIKNALVAWKEKNNFKQPINLTLIPMDWKVEIGL